MPSSVQTANWTANCTVCRASCCREADVPQTTKGSPCSLKGWTQRVDDIKTECEDLHLAVQEDGTLVLLDFGQCKALTAARQRALARLIIALDKGRPPGVVAAMKVLAFPLTYFPLWWLCTWWHCFYVHKPVQGATDSCRQQWKGLAMFCGAQGMGMEFKDLQGHAADPVLVTIVANIIFDVRCVHFTRKAVLLSFLKGFVELLPKTWTLAQRTLSRSICTAAPITWESYKGHWVLSCWSSY